MTQKDFKHHKICKPPLRSGMVAWPFHIKFQDISGPQPCFHTHHFWWWLVLVLAVESHLSLHIKSVLVCFSCCYVRTLTNCNSGTEGFIWFITYNPSSRNDKTGTQCRNLVAGTVAKSVEEFCLWDFSDCFLKTTQGHLARSGINHAGPGPPSHSHINH